VLRKQPEQVGITNVYHMLSPQCTLWDRAMPVAQSIQRVIPRHDTHDTAPTLWAA
jgi:hypothetical protein